MENIEQSGEFVGPVPWGLYLKSQRGLKLGLLSGPSLRGRGREFPPATTNMAPGYFQRKKEEK